MKGIFVSNYNDTAENVMIFRTDDSCISMNQIETILDNQEDQYYDDICEVNPNDFQYYSYTPIYLGKATEKSIQKKYEVILKDKYYTLLEAGINISYDRYKLIHYNLH